jgi:hypothetical protein
MTKLFGIVALVCGGCAVVLGVFFWFGLPDLPAYGITTLGIGAGVCLVGGLMMWLGRHAPPPSTGPARPVKGTTDYSVASTVVDGIFDLLS